MKSLSFKIVFIAVAILSLCGNFCFYAYAAGQEDSLLNILKLKSEDFYKQGLYLEFLEYLSTITLANSDKDARYIEYYSILTKSLYLDYLEKNGDWENYYEYKDILDTEIIETANTYNGQLVCDISIEVYYLAWKARLREEDGREEEAFKKLADALIEFTDKQANIAKFKEISDRLSKEGRICQLNKIYKEYKDYLMRVQADSSSIERLADIADDYLQNNEIDTARIIYEQYISIVISRYSKQQAVMVLKKAAEKFRHHGFWSAKDADFAEKIYSIVENNFGEDCFEERDMFARAYNLDISGYYKKAFTGYDNFIKKFKESKLIPEIYTRMGIISFYFLKQSEQGMVFLQKVMDEFSNCLHGPFCTYESALINQWKKEDKKAKDLYDLLVNSKKGRFADLAQYRLKEIITGEPMNSDFSRPLDLIFAHSENSIIMMSLTAQPDRAFIGQTVKYVGTAQDFSAGTVQPLFTYQWFRDTGNIGNPGNVAEFNTTYETAGPKLICFSAASGDSENIICREVWIQELKINSPVCGQLFKVGQPVRCEAEIIPFVVEDSDFNWKWKINGEEIVTGEGKVFSCTFQKPGYFEGTLEVSKNNEIKQIKNFSFEVTE